MTTPEIPPSLKAVITEIAAIRPTPPFSSGGIPEAGRPAELPPSEPTLDRGLKVLAGTLRQVFNDNQRQIEAINEDSQHTVPPSLENIISEFGLEGGVSWRYSEGEQNKFEAVNADGDVVIEGSFNQHSIQTVDTTLIGFTTRRPDVFQPRYFLSFSFTHGKTQTLETTQLLLGYVGDSHKISYQANAEARPGDLSIPAIPNLALSGEGENDNYLPTSDVGIRNEVISPSQLTEKEQERLNNEKLFANSLSEFARQKGISEDEAYKLWAESEKPPETSTVTAEISGDKAEEQRTSPPNEPPPQETSASAATPPPPEPLNRPTTETPVKPSAQRPKEEVPPPPMPLQRPPIT